jgi:hypothetical protein
MEEISRSEVVVMNVVAGPDGGAGHTDSLPVAVHRITGGDFADCDLVTGWDGLAHRDVTWGDPFNLNMDS